MKILIISDTHGDLCNFRRVIEKERPIDQLLHLGDFLRDDDEIRALADCACAFVRGNCDYFSDERDFRDFGLLGHNIHMEHGHMLPDSFDAIASRAVGLGADILLFGHTHVPVAVLHRGIHIINPGSLSKPRQSNRLPSYVIMELDAGGNINYSIRYLEG